uniref:Uncharacterized protein n=1 Tax=Anguilla anguilla TaxID=7936 RepID=A0A0E9RTZ5_ANGAN
MSTYLTYLIVSVNYADWYHFSSSLEPEMLFSQFSIMS